MLRKPPLPYLVVWRLVPWLCRGRRPHGDGNRLVFGGVVGCEAMLRPVGCAFPRRAVLCCAVLCCAVPCCPVLAYAVSLGVVLCFAVLCFAVLCFAVLCFAVLCFAVLCFAVLRCAVLCFAVVCRVVLCHPALCCAMLRCAVLWCCVLCCVAALGRGKEYHAAPCPLGWVGGDPCPLPFTRSIFSILSYDGVSGLDCMPPRGQGLGAAAWWTPLLVLVPVLVSHLPQKKKLHDLPQKKLQDVTIFSCTRLPQKL